MFRRFFNQWPRFLFGWISLTLSMFGYILTFDLVEVFLIAPSSFVMIAITSAVLVGLPMLFVTLFIPRFLTMVGVVSLTGAAKRFARLVVVRNAYPQARETSHGGTSARVKVRAALYLPRRAGRGNPPRTAQAGRPR